LAWGGGTQGVPGRRTAAVVITLLFLLSIGMLMRIAYAGIVFDVQADSRSKEAGNKPQANSTPINPAPGAKRA
jgi:hypothetical protein